MKIFHLLVLGSWISVQCLTSGCPNRSSTEPAIERVELEEIDDVLPNPYKGFAPWIGSANPVYNVKLQVATFGWADIEPQEGVYNWTRLEQNWGNIAVTGKRVGFRIAAEIPGSGQNDTPQWLIDKGVAMRPYSIDDHDGLVPDWNNPDFLEAHHHFIMALGSRYDGDPRVAWIDIGSYGFWGEWHVWLNDDLAATQATKQAILEDYFEAFLWKPKVIAFDDDFATEYVTDHGGGIRNDCLGTEDANNWYLTSLNRIDLNMNNQVWKTAVITGEFCGGQTGAIEGTTSRFNLNFEFIQRAHWSFIGPAGGAIVPQSTGHRESLDRLHKTLGYRFVFKRVDHSERIRKGEELSITIEVENKGIAPFYLNWPLIMVLIDADGIVVFSKELDIDIRQWLPGVHIENVTVTLPDKVTAQTYDIRLAIPDPDYDIPGILFANTGGDEEGRFLVSRLIVYE